jgi:hypothetical protein
MIFADLDKLEAFFRERGAPVCHEVSPLAGVPVTDLLSQRGYRPVEFTSVMYRTLPRSAGKADAVNPPARTRLMAAGEEEH